MLAMSLESYSLAQRGRIVLIHVLLGRRISKAPLPILMVHRWAGNLMSICLVTTWICSPFDFLMGEVCSGIFFDSYWAKRWCLAKYLLSKKAWEGLNKSKHEHQGLHGECPFEFLLMSLWLLFSPSSWCLAAVKSMATNQPVAQTSIYDFHWCFFLLGCMIYSEELTGSWLEICAVVQGWNFAA